MIIPHPRFNAHKVAFFIYQSGKATRDECAAHFSHMERRKLIETIKDMVFRNMLSDNDGVLTCKPYLTTHYNQSEPQEKAKGKIAPPREATPFKPLSAKNLPSLALLREPIRTGMSFINGSSGFQVLGYRT